MARNRFLRELNRRHVFRVAVAYAVAGWALIEVTSTVVPALRLPESVTTVIVLLTLLGFPLAVILAWAFELTPDGVRRTEPAHSPAARPPEHAHRIGWYLNIATIAVLAIAVGFLGWRQFVSPQAVSPQAVAPQDRATAPAIKPVTAAIDSVLVKSIAVLPFQNLSADVDNAFFADGIQDEILTGLAKIGDLKVISSASTRRYESTPTDLSLIRRQLNVANILEGSVQRVGDRVRIIVQLIDARTDNHVWAETFDRTLDDVFVVESEVARKIAKSLHATLTGGERTALAAKPTDNAEAYAAYLKGRALLVRSAFDRDNGQRMIDAFQRAATLDPNFALAWGELAQQHVWMYWEGFDPTSARVELARTALHRAEALAPTSPQVALARGLFLYYGERDFVAALKSIRKAQQGLPNDAQVWKVAALLERRLGQWDEAVADFGRARVLSPNDISITFNAAVTLASQRRFRETIATIDAGLAVQPNDPSSLALKLFAVRVVDGLDAAEPILAALPPDVAPTIANRGRQAQYRRDYATASELFTRAIEASGSAQAASSFNGYIPAAIDYQLQLATCEQRRGSQAAADEIYRKVQASAQAALATKPASPNVKAAWHAALGLAEAGLRQREQAVREGQAAIDAVAASNDAAEGPSWLENLAMIHAMQGDAAHAVPLIKQLLQTSYLHPLTTALLVFDPVFDPIRADSEFRAMIN